MSDFEKFKEGMPRKKQFYSSLKGKKNSDKEIWTCSLVKFKMKAVKDYHDLYLKCDVLFLANFFWKI